MISIGVRAIAATALDGLIGNGAGDDVGIDLWSTIQAPPSKSVIASLTFIEPPKF